MNAKFPKWEPKSDVLRQDQIAGHDEVRSPCPVAHSEQLYGSMFRHADVVRVLNDPNQFSNVVSSHLAVPNGFDPPEHTLYRRIIDPHFSAQRMAAFEPVCRGIAKNLVARLPRETEIEIATEFADIFAIEVQCAFLDWPESLHQPLLRWTRTNDASTLSGDRDAMAAVAVEFDGYIRDLLAEGRNATFRRDDAATRLSNERFGD